VRGRSRRYTKGRAGQEQFYVMQRPPPGGQGAACMPEQEQADLSRLWPGLLALAAGVAGGEPPGLDTGAAALWRLYAPLAGSRSGFVLGQIGQSLDGRIATPTGRSHYVNGPAALDHLHRLRALADAVVVGIGTVLSDDPQLTVRRVDGRSPARVVIDPNGRLPSAARLLADDGVRVLVVQAGDRPRPPRVEAVTLAAGENRLEPRAIREALAERGLRRLLIEGGAHTLSAFLAAGALDRLHVAVAPLIIGSGPTGLMLPPIDRLDSARRPRVTIHRLGDDVLFDCALAARLCAGGVSASRPTQG
jgi:diaminohydroxyphosphoribosylaminopyrimidine deaminase / 5-amino-6-(5-phosphoribosylamino)uracil reductase